MGRRKTAADRFWEKVDKSGDCWNWTAAQNGHGYGIIWVEGHLRRAHRYSYQISRGPIPSGMVVDHTCHNRRCVNPEHLRAVTQKQNIENHTGAQADSRSGVRGVYAVSGGRYLGAVKHNGVPYTTGRLATLAEAEAAVVELRNRLFTHNDLDRKRK